MRAKLVLGVALACSGAASLAYQVAWSRMLQRVFGVSDLAVATVLSAFFLGLGLGSVIGGRWAAGAREPQRVYAALELGVALYALATLALVPSVPALLGGLGPESSFGQLALARAAIALGVLVLPTLAMGATMPFVLAVVARDDAREWTRVGTALYAMNTLGAVLGAGLTGLVLLPELGTRTTLLCAAGASVLAGALVLTAKRANEAKSADPADTNSAQNNTQSDSSGMPVIALVVAALAGFGALAAEVVWTRVLRIVFQATTQAFSAMLVVFLLGLGLGSLALSRVTLAPRPAARWLGRAQLGVAAWSVAAIAIANQTPRLLGLLQGHGDMSARAPAVILAASAVLLLPLALGLGATVPLTWQMAGAAARDAPRAAGAVLAANTLGGLAGSLVAGFSLIPAVGVSGAIVGLITLHALVAALALRASEPRTLAGRVAALTVPLALAVSVPVVGLQIDLPYLLGARESPARALLEGPGPAWRQGIVFLREGRNTTVTVTRSGDALRLLNDGRPESGFVPAPPGFGAELALLGGLPAALSSGRDRALVVGLGGGHSTTVLLEAGYARVDVVELEEAVVEAARWMHHSARRAFPLDDTRAHLTIDDARARLVLAAPGTYDAIVSQPSHPWLAGSSALYTREFFLECKRALRPGGVLTLWVNLFRMDAASLRSILATLHAVFPHAQAYRAEDSSLVLIASATPLTLDVQVERRLRTEPLRTRTLTPSGLDSLASLLGARVAGESAIESASQGAAQIVDDRPLLEFQLARLRLGHALGESALDRVFARTPWLTTNEVRDIPPAVRARMVLARLDRVRTRRGAILRVLRDVPSLGLDASDTEWVRGRAAELLGDVAGALTHYDAARSPDAELAGDRLRLRAGLSRDVVRRAETAAVSPRESSFRLLAYLDARAPIPPAILDDPRLATWAEQARTCSSDAAPDVDPSLLGAYELAAHLERCAVLRTDPEAARRAADARVAAARVLCAADLGEANRNASEGNAAAAIVALRHALRVMPANANAAAALARLLAARGDRDEATALLRATLLRVRGLPSSTAALHDAAAALTLEIGARPTSDDASGASAAPHERRDTRPPSE